MLRSSGPGRVLGSYVAKVTYPPLSPVIRLGLRNPRKKGKKRLLGHHLICFKGRFNRPVEPGDLKYEWKWIELNSSKKNWGPWFDSLPFHPRMEKSHSGCPRTAWCIVHMSHKNGMSPLILTNGTICMYIYIFFFAKTNSKRSRKTITSGNQKFWKPHVPKKNSYKGLQQDETEAINCSGQDRG